MYFSLFVMIVALVIVVTSFFKWALLVISELPYFHEISLFQSRHKTIVVLTLSFLFRRNRIFSLYKTLSFLSHHDYLCLVASPITIILSLSLNRGYLYVGAFKVLEKNKNKNQIWKRSSQKN